MLRFAFAVLGLTFVSLPQVQAATLAGDKFDVSFYYPTRSNLYLDQGDFTDPTSRISIPQDPKGYGLLYPYYFRYVFGQYDHFTKSPFDGVVFTDLTSSRITNVLFDKNTDASNLLASDLTFTSNSISLNLSDVTVQAGTVIQLDIKVASSSSQVKSLLATQAPSSVPLPAAAPLFGMALSAIGAFGFGRRRRSALRSIADPC